MKTLKDYANNHGIKYRAAWNRFKANKIPFAFKDEFGKILIPEDKPDKPLKVVCYARVSSSQNKNNLETQSERIVNFSNLLGLSVHSVVKEIGSGLNDKRPKLLRILNDNEITHIIVEHKDRLTRFGFNYIQSWMDTKQCKIIVVNNVDTDKEDLMQDFVSLVTSMVARLYGLRRSKRKTEEIIKELKDDKKINN
jgi:predicted site-specific integrase-resolvase